MSRRKLWTVEVRGFLNVNAKDATAANQIADRMIDAMHHEAKVRDVRAAGFLADCHVEAENTEKG
jgi:hypothetical protein